MPEVIHVLIVCLIISMLAYIVNIAPIPTPFRWIAWMFVFIVAIVALLPLLGIPV